MKGISLLMKLLGGVMVIGTAGSADHVTIGFEEAFSGAMSGILLIVLASCLPRILKGFRYIALAILR